MDETLDMLDQRKRSPKNKWCRDQRVVLCLLYRFYQRENKAFAAVFNAIFENEIRECGFTSGFPYSSLNAQWASMRRDGHTEWWEVHVQTPFERSGTWSNVLLQIESTANSLGISLKKKEEDDIDTSKFSLRRNITPPMSSTDLPSTVPSPDTQSAPDHELASMFLEGQGPEDSDSESTAEDSTTEADFNLGRTRTCAGRPCRLCHEGEGLQDAPESVLSGLPGLPIMPSMPVTSEFTCPNVPSVLYRWSNVDSMGINSKQHLVAGLFASELKLKSPEEYSVDDFRNLVLQHVRIMHVPSPFISTFMTPLSPIHRALKKREGALVTIIDPSQLQTPIYSAQALVSNLALREGWYCGVGEYLIWGSVPSQAIVTSFKISDLERIAAEDQAIGEILQFDQIEASVSCGDPLRRALARGPGKVDHSSGFTVGRLLRRLSVPQSHSEAVAGNITCSWKFGHAGTWDDFSDGLRAAYAISSERSAYFASPAQPSVHEEDAPDSQSDDYVIVGSEEGDYAMVDSEEAG